MLEHQVESHKRDAATLRDEITTLGKEALALGKEAATLRKKIELIGKSLKEFPQQATRFKRDLHVDANGLIREVPHPAGELQYFLGSYPVSKEPLPPELREMVSNQLDAQRWMDQTLSAIESALKLPEKTEAKAEKNNQLDTKTPDIDF